MHSPAATPQLDAPGSRAHPSASGAVAERLETAANHIRFAFDVRERTGGETFREVAAYLSENDGLAPQLLTAFQHIANRMERRSSAVTPMAPHRFVSILDRLVQQRVERIVRPAATFPATCTKSLGERTRVVVAHPSGTVPVEYRQALAARRWGNALAFERPEQQVAYEARVVSTALSGLAQDLIDFDQLERVHGAALVDPVAPETAEDMEHLVCDILNEKEPVASEASLYDDVLNASDLCVKYGVNGSAVTAYVQVTANPLESALASKRAQVQRKARRMVLVTPWSIGGVLVDPHARAVARIEPELAWDALSAIGMSEAGRVRWEGQKDLLHEASQRILSVLRDALEKPNDDARGPIHAVPQGLRECIRRYVQTRVQLAA